MVFTAYICHVMSVNLREFPPIVGIISAPKHVECRILHNRSSCSLVGGEYDSRIED